MPTQNQIEANRANAAHSTGPQTPAGKARASQNARKHGFTASSFAVVRLEELDCIARLKADLIACYQPVNSQELFAIERIALAQQALLRVTRLEAGFFSDALNHAMSPDGRLWTPLDDNLIADLAITRQQNRNIAIASGFQHLAKQSNAWVLLLRYQSQAERQYRRAIEEFERLKALRKELPNEPIQEPDVEDYTQDPLNQTDPIRSADYPQKPSSQTPVLPTAPEIPPNPLAPAP